MFRIESWNPKSVCLIATAYFILITIPSGHSSIGSCIKSAGLHYITEQVDLECLKTVVPSMLFATNGMSRDERARMARSVAPGGFPFPANWDAIPKSLMEVHADMRELLDNARELRMARKDDQMCTEKGCFDLPSTMCETTSDVVTPINATSATSGQTVWIAQYPGLFIQTITYSKCKNTRCYYLNGGCRQMFSPYLLMTHPPGPVSIFGQDYVLVESGCVCEPTVSANNRTLNNDMEMYLPRRNIVRQK